MGGSAVVQLALEDRDHIFVFAGFVEMFLAKDLEEQDVFVASLRRFRESFEERVDRERDRRCLGGAALANAIDDQETEWPERLGNPRSDAAIRQILLHPFGTTE